MSNDSTNKFLTIGLIGGFAALVYNAMSKTVRALSAQEDAALQSAAKYLNVPAEWLLGVMFLESSLNPQAKNNVTGATGLIQFMPATAGALGTSVDELAQMDFVTQMEFVKKYFKQFTHAYNSFVDLYLTVFYPAAIKQNDDYQFPDAVAKSNPGYAQDGIITKGILSQILASRLFTAGISV